MKKIYKGVYEYTTSKEVFTIDKDYTFPEYDWRVFNSKGEWLNTFLTLKDAKLWLDTKEKQNDKV